MTFGMLNSGIAKRRQRPEHLAGDRRIVERLRRLHLVGRDDDVVDQDAGHEHVMRLQRAALGDALHLRDDDAAIVAGRERLVERAEIGALMLVGEVAALVGRGGADDRHLRHDGREDRASPRHRTRTLLTIGSAAPRAFMAQPSRSGSTKVSRPTLVSTPGRLAAASRCMSNRMPEGML